MASSITRISGMVSGLDTDSIVKKLMQAEQVPLNKMKQNQQKLTWESDGYRQWNKDIFSFRSTTLFNMKLSGTFGTYAVASSDSNILNGTATADAIPGTYSYQVNNIAQSAAIKSSNLTIDPTQALSNTPANLTVTATDHTGTARTATVTINAGDKIGDVVSKLNTAKDASGNSLGLQAGYDSTLKQFILNTKDTGAGTKISISADVSDFLDTTLGFSASAGYANGFKKISAGNYVTATDADAPDPVHPDMTNPNIPRDAKLTFNGTAVASASNTFTIMGVNYTLKNTTPSGTTGSITVSRDIDTEVKNIKDFVSKYNDMLDKLNTAVNEPVYRDYQPLTDDQRSAMSETQIQQWEAKAKSGLFHNDSTLTGLINDIQNHSTSTVDNGSPYNSLVAIGIASQSYQDKGKLYVDETKLRAALQADPDAVKNLFSQSPVTATDSQKGIMVRLYDDFQNAFTKLTDKAGVSGNAQDDQSIVGKLLQDVNNKINDEQQRLTDKENQYYKKFTALETAMSKYNSQSAWLTQQLGGGQNAQ